MHQTLADSDMLSNDLSKGCPFTEITGSEKNEIVAY